MRKAIKWKYLHLKGLRGTEIYEDMIETLNNDCHIICHCKNWVAYYKRGKFFNQDYKETWKKIDVVYHLMLSDRRIGRKAEALSV